MKLQNYLISLLVAEDACRIDLSIWVPFIRDGEWYYGNIWQPYYFRGNVWTEESYQSIKVPSRCCAVVYEWRDLKGDSIVICNKPDGFKLPPSFSDVISSIDVIKSKSESNRTLT